MLFVVIPFCCGFLVCVEGQGRLLDPPGRASVWRLGYDTPVNQNDNVLNCGGLQRRWEVNQGKCGVCGDPWDSNPRSHELGGTYSSGIITKAYTQGEVIEILVDIPNPTDGYFEVQLCDITDARTDATEACFQATTLTLEDKGETKYSNIIHGENKARFVLPSTLTCVHCVLRWKYRPADTYGCEIDTKLGKEVCGFGMGKYYNEYFGCADISIVNTTTYGHQGDTQHKSLSRQKRTAHLNHLNNLNKPATGSNITPYIPIPDSSNIRTLPFTRLGRPQAETRTVRWSWGQTVGAQTPGQMFSSPTSGNMQNIQNKQQNLRLPSRNFPNNVDISRLEIGRGEMFPGSIPMPALVRVEQPVVRQILRPPGTSGGVAINNAINNQMFRRMPIERTPIQNTFMKPMTPDFGPRVSVNTINKHVFTKHRIATKQCAACPFDQCLDKTLELDSIFPGLFEKPADFLECKQYTKLFSLGKYKLLSEGLPSCAHPRFKRQLRTVTRIDDDDFGCCGTRPQVVLPLTVESDRESYNVVQLPNERNQFLVQGICGHDNTTSCSACVAENNFQWVLVYDPRVNTSPPVSFVPVKFPHYCRCLNPGRRFNIG